MHTLYKKKKHPARVFDMDQFEKIQSADREYELATVMRESEST